jgi:cation diffusion facilitator CzcD-associated flavoprotein CzcO
MEDFGVGTAPELEATAVKFLQQLEDAFNRREVQAYAGLFRADGSWRDAFATTGSLRTADGPERIGSLLGEIFQRTPARKLHIIGVTRAEAVTRYGFDLTEAFFEFSTEVGCGIGVIRLLPDDIDPERPRALSLLTALQWLATNDVGPVRSEPGPQAESETRSWAEQRQIEREFADREPVALVVGAGQAGLATAAWLKRLGVDCLVVERSPRVGDNWRNRYRALSLHNDTRMNHLPFLPFPDFFPAYIPKDKLGNWFEFYADVLELNVWTNAQVVSGSYDTTSARWDVDVRRGDSTRALHPRHLVIATGVSGVPHRPKLPGIDVFHGATVHTHEYADGSPYAGKRVLVVGTGASGHDVAQDLHLHGAKVTMMQRSKTIVTSLEAANGIYSALYLSGRATEECDLIGMAATFPILRRFTPTVTESVAAMDKELLDGLHAVGFQTHYGEGNMGYPTEFRRRGGGYYLDVGCSRLLIEGKIGLVQAADLDQFTEDGIILRDGTALQFDACVLATGYASMQEGVRQLLGSEIADRVGPIWGLDEEGELRNMARRTAQDGLWFLGGGFPEVRKHSRHLALQIQAAELGIQL